MSTPEGERIAALETEVKHLQATLDRVSTSVNEISVTLAQAKGGWTTLMLVAGVASSVGALLAKFVPFLTLR